MSTTPSIPVIDFQDFPSESQKLLQASKDWGCFRLINHSIPSTLMAEMKATVRALLDLPMEIKQRNRDVIAGSGYVAPTNINPLFEGLGLYDIGSPEAVHEFCSQLEASPLETIIKYSEAVHELAMDIGRKLCQSMGLNMDLFKARPCQFRINKYHFTPESVGSSGVQIHTDSEFLTILQDDESVGGLEVLDEKSGAFIAVDPLPGSILVNFGDTAKVWSNGRFCNVRLSTGLRAGEALALLRTATYGICEVLWIKQLLEELKVTNPLPMKVFCDNKAAIAIAQNPVLHDRTKHVEVDKHFIKEKLDDGLIVMPYIPTAELVADILTKGLSKKQFDDLVSKLSMNDIFKPA